MLFKQFKTKPVLEVGFLKERIGKITHYFDKIGVAVVELEAQLVEGERISIEKDGQGFEQNASSMQVDKKPVKKAEKGQAIGMRVEQAVKPGFEVYKIK